MTSLKKWLEDSFKNHGVAQHNGDHMYIMWPADDGKALLDGTFSLNDLEEIIAFMRGKQ